MPASMSAAHKLKNVGAGFRASRGLGEQTLVSTAADSE